MPDCISSLCNLLNTSTDDIKHLGFDVFIDIWSMVVSTLVGSSVLGAGREVALVERVWLQNGQSRQLAHLNRIIQVKDGMSGIRVNVGPDKEILKMDTIHSPTKDQRQNHRTFCRSRNY
jgi:hypothetical protein